MLYVHSTKEPHFSVPRGVIRHIPLTAEWIFKSGCLQQKGATSNNYKPEHFPGKIK